ncbi:MAG: hypothetical protein FWC50_08815 [Planctomycetaceae bacterium]|nr:hypothetical protein [Planctomycetaceae bacterium]
MKNDHFSNDDPSHGLAEREKVFLFKKINIKPKNKSKKIGRKEKDGNDGGIDDTVGKHLRNPVRKTLQVVLSVGFIKTRF